MSHKVRREKTFMMPYNKINLYCLYFKTNFFKVLKIKSVFKLNKL